ncbi:unnamed protein product, partial [Meganyctiphanes norvegica]
MLGLKIANSLPGRAVKLNKNREGMGMVVTPFPPQDRKSEVISNAANIDNDTRIPTQNNEQEHRNGYQDSNTEKKDIFGNTEFQKTVDFVQKEKQWKRPSTAVKNHLKKISEEFSVTQSKYEKSNKPVKGKASGSQSAKNSRKGITPIITSVTSKKSEQKIDHAKTKFKKKNTHRPAHVPQPPPTPSPRPYRPIRPPKPIPGSPALQRACGRKSATMNGPVVNALSMQQSNEHTRLAKMFTERAILEGRVFSIYGYFPAVKESLVKRGWVEKHQQSAPYVNPHPANCVCPHIGYHPVF